MPEEYGQDYDDAELMSKYRFDLTVGEDLPEALMKYSSLEFGTRLNF